MCPKCGGYVLEDRDESDISRFLGQGIVGYCVNCGKRLFPFRTVMVKLYDFQNGYYEKEIAI